MKNIVLYVFAVIMMYTMEAVGQKSAIHLLPSDHVVYRGDRVADTGCHSRPVTEFPGPITDYPGATVDTSRVVKDGERVQVKQPYKSSILFYRLLFPHKIMILDITAYKP